MQMCHLCTVLMYDTNPMEFPEVPLIGGRSGVPRMVGFPQQTTMGVFLLKMISTWGGLGGFPTI